MIRVTAYSGGHVLRLDSFETRSNYLEWVSERPIAGGGVCFTTHRAVVLFRRPDELVYRGSAAYQHVTKPSGVLP